MSMPVVKLKGEGLGDSDRGGRGWRLFKGESKESGEGRGEEMRVAVISADDGCGLLCGFSVPFM